MAKVFVPFNKEMMFDIDDGLYGEFTVPLSLTPVQVRAEFAKKFFTVDDIDGVETNEEIYDLFCTEYETTIDGAWSIEEDLHKKFIKSIEHCISDTETEVAGLILKKLINELADDVIYF